MIFSEGTRTEQTEQGSDRITVFSYQDLRYFIVSASDVHATWHTLTDEWMNEWMNDNFILAHGNN